MDRNFLYGVENKIFALKTRDKAYYIVILSWPSLHSTLNIYTGCPKKCIAKLRPDLSEALLKVWVSFYTSRSLNKWSLIELLKKEFNNKFSQYHLNKILKNHYSFLKEDTAEAYVVQPAVVLLLRRFENWNWNWQFGSQYQLVKRNFFWDTLFIKQACNSTLYHDLLHCTHSYQ